MDIKVEIDKGEVDVVIYSVPYFFSEKELMEKMEFGRKRAIQQGITFLAVIDYDATSSTISENSTINRKFDCIAGLPKESPEYRVALFVEFSKTFYDVFDEKPETKLDWLLLFGKAVVVANDVYNAHQSRAFNYPFAQDPWTTVVGTRQEAIDWCRRNAPWK